VTNTFPPPPPVPVVVSPSSPNRTPANGRLRPRPADPAVDTEPTRPPRLIQRLVRLVLDWSMGLSGDRSRAHLPAAVVYWTGKSLRRQRLLPTISTVLGAGSSDSP
jgi:hypothetical protein